MESGKGIERVESQYGENKVNGNWKRVKMLSSIRKMVMWLLRYRRRSKCNTVYRV